MPPCVVGMSHKLLFEDQLEPTEVTVKARQNPTVTSSRMSYGASQDCLLQFAESMSILRS